MPPGEFFSMLGPSGCGKTTTLRMIAGFEQPSDGRILLDGADVAYVPPHKRNVNTVFQSYALFPHLNVFDNVAFGLRRQRAPKHDVKRRIEQVAGPRDVYEEPATTFVADFLGVSNLMSAQANGRDSDGRCRVMLDSFELRCGRGDVDARGDAKIVIRPERVRLEPHESA